MRSEKIAEAERVANGLPALLDGEVPGINRNSVVYGTCGFGKTFLVAALMIAAAKQGKRSLFVMGMDTLVVQSHRTLVNLGVEPRVIKAGGRWKQAINLEDELMSIGSIGTMNARSIYPEADVVLIDEAHLSICPSYDSIYKRYPNAWILGVTGTPMLADRKRGMSQRYSNLILSPYMDELIEVGRQTNFEEGLVPIEYFGLPEDRAINVDDVKSFGGDFNQADLQAKCDTPKVRASSIAAWRQLAWHPRGEWRRTIGFCTGITDSLATTAAFNEAFRDEYGGDIAAHIDGDAEDDERTEKFGKLKSGEIRILFSVALIKTGFDVVEVECILDKAPTKSASSHIQKLSRGIRVAPNIGKTECLVIDQAGNVARNGKYGMVADYKPTQLDEPKPPSQGEAPTKICPELEGGCGRILYTFQMVCPHCEFRYPLKELRERVGDMVKLLSGDEKKKHKTYVKLLKKAFEKGYLPGWAQHQANEKLSSNARFPADWRLGAVFGGQREPAQIENYLNYLMHLVTTKKKWFEDRSFSSREDIVKWISTELRAEFGVDCIPDRISTEKVALSATQAIAQWNIKQRELFG